MNRREFLSTAGMAAAAAAAVPHALAAPVATAPGSFHFAFVTDTHIQPELNAATGTADCFRKVRSIKPDFVLHGGDMVMDALGVPATRSTSLFDLYKSTEDLLGLKVRHTLGNHDIFGIYAKSGVVSTDPRYGKKYFADHMGPTYYSFDYKGYHFVVLDSIQITPDLHYTTLIDDPQIEWLRKDLAAIPAGMPVIVSTHAPLVTAALQYSSNKPKPDSAPSFMVDNAYKILPVLESANTILVLQGHTHIHEVVSWHGISYVTGGAVCGNWWHGLRWGTPEGFLNVQLNQGKASWNYETYGFKSVAPEPSKS